MNIWYNLGDDEELDAEDIDEYWDTLMLLVTFDNKPLQLHAKSGKILTVGYFNDGWLDISSSQFDSDYWSIWSIASSILKESGIIHTGCLGRLKIVLAPQMRSVFLRCGNRAWWKSAIRRSCSCRSGPKEFPAQRLLRV